MGPGAMNPDCCGRYLEVFKERKTRLENSALCKKFTDCIRNNYEAMRRIDTIICDDIGPLCESPSFLQYTVATVIRDALQEYQLTTIQIYAKFSPEPHRRYCMTCQSILQKLFKIEILYTELPSLVEKIPASLSIGKGAGMMSFSTKRGNKSSEQVLSLTEHPGGPAAIVRYYIVATGVQGGVGTSA
jgi:hypothetical protein